MHSFSVPLKHRYASYVDHTLLSLPVTSTMRHCEGVSCGRVLGQAERAAKPYHCTPQHPSRVSTAGDLSGCLLRLHIAGTIATIKGLSQSSLYSFHCLAETESRMLRIPTLDV